LVALRGTAWGCFHVTTTPLYVNRRFLDWAVVPLPTDTPCTCPNRATSAPSQRIACLTCAIAASPSFAVASIHTASVAFSLSASVMRVLLLTSEFFPPVVGETNSARVARWVRCEEPIQATPESGHPYPRSPVIRLCLRM